MNHSDRGRFARLIDSAIAVFSPSAALRRTIAWQQLSAVRGFRYEGARAKRDRVQATGQLHGAESSVYQRDRIQLMKEARNLEENGAIANAILGKFEAHVTGRLRYQPATGSKRVDDKIREWFADWSKRADATGRHSLRKLVQIGLRGTLTDGDSGFVPFIDDDNEARVIGIEADRLGTPWDLAARENYVGGIHLDAMKKPIAYEVYKRDIFDRYVDPQVIPAAQFCHLANQNRFDRYRGITSFASVIETAVDIEEIVQFEKLAVKWGSMQTAVVTGSPGGPPSNAFYADGNDAKTGEARNVEPVEYGNITYLPKEGEVTQFRTERPGAAWEGFLQFLIRLYAAGSNLPYGFVFDISASRGPGSRFEAEQARRTFEAWQDLLVEKVLDRVKNVALIAALANGDIPTHRNFLRGRWQFPRHPSIDIGRESSADVAEVNAGIKSHRTVLQKYALDDSEEREQIATELADWMRLSEEKGIPLELLVGDRAKHLKKPEPKPATPPPTDMQSGLGGGFVFNDNRREPPPPAVSVKTPPVNVTFAQGGDARGPMKKEITLQKKNGKIVGAVVTEIPGPGEPTSKKVALNRGNKTIIDGKTILEVPK